MTKYTPPYAVATERPTIESLVRPEQLEYMVSQVAVHVDDTLLRKVPAVVFRQTESLLLRTLGGFRLELLRSARSGPAIQPHVATTMPAYPMGPNSVALSLGLRLALDSQSAKFRSAEQEHACYLVAHRQTDVAFFAPCDAGKSMAYIIPILALDGFQPHVWSGWNILVVPYISLAEAASATVAALGIPVHQWRPDAPGLATVTVVLSDQVSHPLFRQEMWAAAHTNQLTRIIFDEAHVYVTEAGFRHTLPAVAWLQQFSAPRLYLSATMPPAMYPQLREDLGITSEPEVIRLTAARLRARLVAEPVHRRDRLARIRQLIATHCVQPGDRAIVFSYSVASAKSNAQELGCPAYVSDMLIQEKRTILKAFADGLHQVVCATSALAAGISVSQVVLIIIDGFPPDAIVFEQEIGRGGRNNEAFAAYLLYERGSEYRGAGQFGGPELFAIVHRADCLRSISEYITGERLTCSSLIIIHGRAAVTVCSNCEGGTCLRRTVTPIADQVHRDFRTCTRLRRTGRGGEAGCG